MTKKRSKSISTFGSRLTSIVSMSLVLIVLGALAVTMFVAREASHSLQSNIGVVVRLVPGADDSEANEMKRYLATRPYVGSYVYTSADDVLKEEMEYNEDILELLDGENPYQAEFDIKVKPEYATEKQINTVSAELQKRAEVDSVVTPANLATDVNSIVDRTMFILTCVSCALLLISIVLIFNTVNLSIYSRRFIIHTMKLVGARPGFIRRPFIAAGALNGFIAGILAAGVIVAICSWLCSIDPIIASALPWWPQMTLVLVGVVVVGILISTVASIIATNCYLRKDYDAMFAK